MAKPLRSSSLPTRRGVLGGLAGMVFAGVAYRAATRSGDPEVVADLGIIARDVRENGLVGKLFMPVKPTGLPAVVSLAGAGGGLWEAPAWALAKEGFPTLALATHNYEDRPSRLRLLPIEYVVDGVEWLRHRANSNGIVALRGWSRGGELALLAASLTPAINGVIAYAPRCYVAREQNKQNNFDDPAVVAAFTWGGAPVDGVPLPEVKRLDPKNPSFEDLHGIAVERITGPIMLVSGTADTGIAGTTAEIGCAYAMRRLELNGFRYPHLHFSYPGAGHSIAEPPPFAGPIVGGGSLAADAAAIADSWPRSLKFLRAMIGE